jgi:hypothetical protein
MVDAPNQSPAGEGIMSPGRESLETRFWRITPDIFGGSSYFYITVVGSRRGHPVGHYRLWYINGALQSDPGQNWWTVNETTGPAYGYQIIVGSTAINFPRPAGVTQADDHYSSQAAAEAAYNGLYVDFDISDPAVIYMVLSDNVNNDNVAGVPNPTFLLELTLPL